MSMKRRRRTRELTRAHPHNGSAGIRRSRAAERIDQQTGRKKSAIEIEAAERGLCPDCGCAAHLPARCSEVFGESDQCQCGRKA